MIYWQNEILLSNKKEGTADTCKMDEFQKYVKLKSLTQKSKIPFISDKNLWWKKIRTLITLRGIGDRE